MPEKRDNRQNERTTKGAGGERVTQGGSRKDVENAPRTDRELDIARGRNRGIERARPMDFFRDPFSAMDTFRREIDRLFDDFGIGGGLLRTPWMREDIDRNLRGIGSSIWSPRIEVAEREGKLIVSADLPGMHKDDVHVEVLDDNLTIEGERRSEQRDEHGGWSERSYGRFFRSIPLPEGVNADTAHASFENGVLQITFDAPKREEKKRGRQIEIGEGRKTKS